MQMPENPPIDDFPLRLIAENLRCERRGQVVFEGLGFCLPEGSLLILSGANGSGKTSLLHMLAGLLPPMAGRVTWAGIPITDPADFERTALFLGHKNALRPEMTVLENITFWAALSGNEMLVAAALHYFGLGEYMHTPCWQLSQGWQRRVALTRLMSVQAPLWLLDEPASNLDQEGQTLLAELIRGRVKNGGTVVMSAHGSVAMHREVTVTHIRLEDFAVEEVEA